MIHNRGNPSAQRAATALRASSKMAMAVAIVLVGVNLRPVITSVGPVLESIRLGLGMSPTSIGFLITLPILCFGAFAPLAPRLLRYQTIEQLISYGLLALAFGIGLRSFFGITGLFTGTLISGASISVIMVFLPSLIKRDFSHQAGHIMGLYSMALCLGAAIAAGATVPLQNILGGDWRWALAFWLLPALATALVWRRQLPRKRPQQAEPHYAAPRLLFSPLAWQVTVYMGLQSMLSYCVFGWLPAILIDRGMTPLLAGLVVSISIAVQLITALSGPWLATRGRDQRAMITLVMALTLAGLLGCMYAPIQYIWYWVALLGLGQGGAFSIALALLVLRSPTAQTAAALSGMAQGGGYTIAALGPLIVGLLHQYSHNWHSAAAFFTVAAAVGLAAGLGAGRARTIEVDTDSST